MATTKKRNNESRVRVGVRVRPLALQEINQGGNCSLNIDSPMIRMGRRSFTYDAVFDSNFGQEDLYESVSAPLLSSFIDGYNATIMAYGQTGSGKTFTMGSEAHIEPEESSQAGLIPRFITDFFGNMQRKKAESDKCIEGCPVLLDYTLKASFLEVYGEDVYDLLDSTRNSLPLREDSKGGIVVVGLTSRSISTTAEALEVLHEGTMNRTTAATLMNHTSSRSHAVFTIQMSQVTRRGNSGDSADMTTTSQFTFVDLAGSERMKKTGAEGERAREGIKINEGLLALGNVINALADDDQVKKDKKVHVPYRQSKLTRLLQDALGGNSQTLFLACVSPSHTNASETLSTLNYANRARNIRNAPTKNVDGASAELNRLQNINRVLQLELVKSRFTAGGASVASSDIGKIDESLLKREDVETYMQQVYDVADAMMSPSKTLRSPPLLIFDVSSKSPTARDLSVMNRGGHNDPMANQKSKSHNGSSEKFDHSILEDINPDEEIAILDYLLELQQHDHEYEKSKKQDDMKLIEMDGELEKQETLLLQLRNSLKVYHGMKGKYEELMEEVQQLENEKSNLAKQLDRATTDPTKGCSTAIKKKLEKVEMSLSRARREKRYAEDQERKCKVLERKVHDLKCAKLALQKKQKEDAVRYRKTTEAKTKELLVLKRKAKNADKRMSKLESEIILQKRTLSRRTEYCAKLSDKLKNTESHLVKLLALRQRDTADHKVSSMQRSSKRACGKESKLKESYQKFTEEEMKTKNYIFDRMVLDKVKQARLKNKYEGLVATYSATMRKVVSEVKTLKEIRAEMVGNDCDSTEKAETLRELKENIADLEFKLELIDFEIQDLSVQMPKNISSSEKDIDHAVTKLVKGLSSKALQSILFETFSKFVEAETERQNITELLKRKDAALIGAESEVDSLNFKVKVLSKDLGDRKALDETENGHSLTIERLTDERNKCMDDLSVAQKNFEQSKKRICGLEDSLRSTQVELAVAKEDLAVVKVSLKKVGGNNEVSETIHQLRRIWEDLGVETSLREHEQKRIEFCFEDTCAKILDDAVIMKHSTEQEISDMSSRLQMMRTALGMSTSDEQETPILVPLLQKLTSLKSDISLLETPYCFAAARRRKIVETVMDLAEVLGLSTAELHTDLKTLLQHENEISNKSCKKLQEAQDIETSEDILPAKSIETDFLTRCEHHISELRVAKSEKLVRDRELGQQIKELIEGMHLNPVQSLQLVDSWMKENEPRHLEWWDSEFAENLLRDIQQTELFPSSTGNHSQYLELISKALSTLADSRRSISEALKSVIEHAQKTLLDIVGREIDASEAYTGFHDALFRMPPLSKDLILSCISELEALIEGTEAMTQTETEALTVVWEALKISQQDRQKFWGLVEESKSNIGVEKNHISLEKLSTSHEEWMVEAASNARNFNQILEKRLKKLEGINNEVERLRSKQDMKSQILSLDSEIRIMNTKLLEFEELKCTKERLLTKKNGGAALLKEERFRKQMRSKFLAKLKQLVNLLRSWESKEKTLFDESLLSDDVRELLKKDPDQMDNWVEMRTKLMPLRTTKTQVVRKRSHEDRGPVRRSKDESSRPASRLTPPKKRMTPSRRSRKDFGLAERRRLEDNGSPRLASRLASRLTPPRNINWSSSRSRNDIGLADKKQVEDKKSSVLRKRDSNSKLDERMRSPKIKKRKQDSFALPFGSILADTPQKNRDNM